MPYFGFVPAPAAAGAPSPSEPDGGADGEPPKARVRTVKIPYAAGVTGEVLVVVLCLLSIYLAAGKDGGGAAEILVIRSAMALMELGRIPMAYLARKLESPAWRAFCFACAICMGFITTFNVFLPYNSAVRMLIAKPEMTAANIVAVEQKGARLHDEVTAKRAAHTEAETRVTTAAQAVANLPKGAAGRKSLQDNLSEARKAERTAETGVKTAEKNEKDFNAKKQAELDKAKSEHRKEVSGNLIYGAAATLLRCDPATISPDMMSTAILLITMISSLVTGFLMSAICLASVERLPPVKRAKPVEAPAPYSRVVDLPNEAVARFLAAAEAPAASAAPQATPAETPQPAAPAEPQEHAAAPVEAQEPASAKPAPKPAQARAARPRGRPRTNPRPNGENHDAC